MGLREERKRQRLTLDAVGFLGGMDGATVSRIERGLVEPRPITVVKLARAFGVSVATMRAHLDETQRNAGQIEQQGAA